ncbi:uncharacterized protein LJ206_016748 [Theristicus caerulescens]
MVTDLASQLFFSAFFKVRKFNSIELIKNIGSMISYFGLVESAIEIAIWAGNCSSCGKSPFYNIYNRKKYETVLNPGQVMYVSCVDEPHVTLIKKPLKTSLQHAQVSIVESHPVKFCDAGSCCTSESNENMIMKNPSRCAPLSPRRTKYMSWGNLSDKGPLPQTAKSDAAVANASQHRSTMSSSAAEEEKGSASQPPIGFSSWCCAVTP